MSNQIEFKTFFYRKQLSQLSSQEQLVVIAAQQATKNAYAPYSHFRVGAAVLLSDGTIVKGANQENAAYPSGLCAERVALFAANAQYPHLSVVAMAIAAFHDGEFTHQPISPCGSCRQVLVETENRFQPFKLFLSSRDEIIEIQKPSDLMPLSFVADDLVK